MPYKNVPERLWGKMDDCVKKVMAKGHDKESAIAICYDSIVNTAEKNLIWSYFIKSEKLTGAEREILGEHILNPVFDEGEEAILTAVMKDGSIYKFRATLKKLLE